METLDEDEAFNEQELVGFGFQELDDEILRRCSHRLSEMLPKSVSSISGCLLPSHRLNSLHPCYFQ
jgi:hypothetical protein